MAFAAERPLQASPRGPTRPSSFTSGSRRGSWRPPVRSSADRITRPTRPAVRFEVRDQPPNLGRIEESCQLGRCRASCYVGLGYGATILGPDPRRLPPRGGRFFRFLEPEPQVGSDGKVVQGNAGKGALRAKRIARHDGSLYLWERARRNRLGRNVETVPPGLLLGVVPVPPPGFEPGRCRSKDGGSVH